MKSRNATRPSSTNWSINTRSRLDYQPLFGKMNPHSPKERLDACDFLCWFKPIMLPLADFRLAKIVTETKIPPLIHRMGKRFQRCGDIRPFYRPKEHNVLFDCLLWNFLLMIVVGEILHLEGSFQGALGLDNCVRYRCNRPRLYLTEEHSIRWKFCLVNQKRFHLIWSVFIVRTHRRRNQYSKIKEN